MAMEEERKYDVAESFRMPELDGCLPGGGTIAARDPVVLTATYYDTADLRLARSGAALRYRIGDREPWTVKLATAVAHVRHEISRPGAAASPPPELVALVSAASRGAPLRPVVVLRSRRERLELRDAAGRVLAEIADDAVSVVEGEQPVAAFREVEVERVEGGRELLDQIEERLLAAGARPGRFPAKHVRALGAPALAPPDLPAPEPLSHRPSGGEVLTAAIRKAVARIFAHDPLTRMREPLPDGDTPVHQLRVGARRLRSDLRTFAPLVDPVWAGGLRRELRWLAGALGAVRDAEVLRQRLWRTAADPLPPVEATVLGPLDSALAARYELGYAQLMEQLGSRRYLRLLDALVGAAQTPALGPRAAAAAADLLPELVTGPWQAFTHGGRSHPAAAALTAEAPDEDWHAVRIAGKRARYAVEAGAHAVAGAAAELARALAAIQDLLGEHQDASVAGETWLQLAADLPAGPELAVAAGRLYERERAAIRHVRAAFPDALRAANQPRLVSWLP